MQPYMDVLVATNSAKLDVDNNGDWLETMNVKSAKNFENTVWEAQMSAPVNSAVQEKYLPWIDFFKNIFATFSRFISNKL